jgi:protein-tyrosine phosphatase
MNAIMMQKSIRAIESAFHFWGFKMVDIHSHILPNIDDGASSLEESIEMLEASVASGVDAIVATPHLYPGTYMAPTTYRDEVLMELRQEVEKRGLQIEIIPGRECYFAPELYDYEKDIGNLTINTNGKYLLVESPMQSIPQYVDRMIFDMQVKGVIPIIAHVERYADVINNPNLLHKFIEMGCLTQVNIGSLFGQYGERIKQTAEILLTHQMVHIVASDMHRPMHRPLGSGFEALCEIVGEEEASNLVEEHPRAVIQKRAMLLPAPLVYQPQKSFKNLWGLLSKPLPNRDDW